MLTPTIRELSEKKLIGHHLEMSIAANKTGELWRNFMPRKNEISNRVNSDLYSMQVFPPSFDFRNFDRHATFEKWAAVEVSDFDNVPDGMETFTLEGGLYAVFP